VTGAASSAAAAVDVTGFGCGPDVTGAADCDPEVLDMCDVVCTVEGAGLVRPAAAGACSCCGCGVLGPLRAFE
jgi:hypothetical protein